MLTQYDTSEALVATKEKINRKLSASKLHELVLGQEGLQVIQ
jgi:hypothetical protein